MTFLLSPLSMPLIVIGFALLFFLSALPLTLRALRRDVLVGLLAPGFIAVRAVALALGLVLGLGAELKGGVLGREPAGEAQPIQSGEGP